MLEPNIILGIVGSSIGILATLVGLAGRTVGVHRSRHHLLEVERQKKILSYKLGKAEVEISLLSRISARGVRHLRCETGKLINHSRSQITKFERFHAKFSQSSTVRGLTYIAISGGSDKISKYAKRFETYSDWITIAQLCISLTLLCEQAWLGASVSSLCMRDVYRLSDELERVKRAKEAHPGRLRKLRVNKGINLGRLEEYADGLVLGFDGSDTGTTSSTITIDDPPEAHKPYRPTSSTREEYHGHRQPSHARHPHDRFRQSAFEPDDHVYDVPRAPPNVYISASRSRRDSGRRRDEQGFRHSRSESRRTSIHVEPSSSRRSHTSTPDSGHDGDDEWNMSRRSQKEYHRYERHHHNSSSDRAEKMTSGPGRRGSVESSRQSRRQRPSSAHINETHSRSHSRQSYYSERSNEPQGRGRDSRRGSVKDTIQRDPSSTPRYRPHSRSSHSSSRRTDARQEQQQQHHARVTNTEIRSPPSRHSSRSSDAYVSAPPSRDSGYGSHDHDRRSSGASSASMRRRSSSGSNRRQGELRGDGGDRSRPPIALDRAERAVRRAEERSRRTSRGPR